MIDGSQEDFNVSADCLDALQRLGHGIFKAELCARMLCSNASWRELLGFKCFGSEILPCFVYEHGGKLAFEGAVTTYPVFAARLLLVLQHVPRSA